MAGEPAAPPQLVLAFDFGTRRIGLATGDTLTRTARGHSTLDCTRGIPWPAIDKTFADLQPAQRSQRVAPVRRQPDFAAQADRVGARPEELAAVVEVADTGAGDDRQRDAALAQLRDHPQTNWLDRPARQPAIAVFQEWLASAWIETQALAHALTF